MELFLQVSGRTSPQKNLEWAVQPPAVTFPHNELIVCVNYDPGGRWVTSAH